MEKFLEISFEWGTTRIRIRTFIILYYINELDDNITSNVLKFGDVTKVFRKVNTDGVKQHLQNDPDRIVKWSEKWQMLNFWKCKWLHTGHGNLDVKYKKTRFNKICHQSQRPIWQVDKEAIGLSRVQQCAFTYKTKKYIKLEILFWVIL